MGFLRCGLLASLLALAFRVHAGFVGVDYEHVATVDSLNTYRVYAVLDDDEDELIALYGDAASPWTLSLDGTLFQAADGGPLATSWTTSDMDSWFTIGSDGPGGTSSLQEVGMTAAWADFESGAGFTVNSAAGGTVFVFPGSSADALAGADGRVLIAQLTMTGTATLTLNLQWRPQGGLMIQEEGVVLTLPQEVGCMDPTACNYDAEALVDDGGCEYTTGDYYDCDGACVNDVDGDGICDELEVLGCTTPEADNYDPLATDDDGSCVAEGCTDATASNYVAWATVDDGSCYWLGCTDPLSLNFDAVATVDDGSCLYVDPSYDGLEAVLVEAGIDGWYIHRLYARFTNPLDELVAVFGDASTPLSIASALGFGQDPAGIVGFGGDDLELPTEPDSWLALGSAAESVLSVGVEDAMAAFEAGDDFTLESPAGGLWYAWPGEGSGIPDADGRVLLGQFASQGLVTVELNLQYLAQSGLAVQETAQSLSFPDLPFGCTDAAACNYDATAQVEDGSCDYLACLGCTDIAACNYAETATTDDGTCTYPESGYGCDGLCLQDADGDGICDPFEVAGCTNSSAQNFNPAATDDDGSCEFLGCTNPISPNYDPVANVDDGTCLIEGCMDPDGLDYNPEATIPTPCTYDAPGYLGLSWSLVEGTSNTYRVYADFANALDQMVAVFGTAYLPLSVTSTSPFLSPPAAGILSSDAGADALGSWFTIGGAPGAVDLQSIGLDSAITSFMAGGNVTLDSPAGGMWFLLPVEDYDGSIGYPDSTGRVLLAQLVTEGQVDLLLNLQYQAPSGEMVVVTGDLQFPGGIPGCIDSLACNFDPNATLVLDGACTYPEEHYDCNGNCLADTDGDGVCDPLEVAGCTDSEAENFSAEATDDDGTCLYSGCTNSMAANYDPQANEDDGSCIIYGCTYAVAVNFSPEANTDDGSCAFDAPETYCGDGTVWDPVAEECIPFSECPTDITGDGVTGIDDLLMVLSSFATLCD